MKYPRGLWYEAPRKRWRVRLYKRGRLYHLSYHTTYKDALAALQAARRHKPEDQPLFHPFANQPTTTKNLIQALRKSTRKP